MKTAKSIDDAESLRPDDVFDLGRAYNDTIMAEPRDSRGGVFHPSAVGACKRKSVYEYTFAPGESADTAQDREVFRLGHAVHVIVQGHMHRLKAGDGITVYFEDEVTYDPATDELFLDFHIGGTTDGVLTLETKSWTQRGIIEIKSIKDKNFALLADQPKPEHLQQAHLYAKRFDCPIIWIFYYNKNTSEYKIYTHLFDQKVYATALARFIEQLDHAAEGTLPDREESFWGCPRCAFKALCQPAILRGESRARSRNALTHIRKKGIL